MIPRGFSRRRGRFARGARPRRLRPLLQQVIERARRNRGTHGLQQRRVCRPLQIVVPDPDRLLHCPVSIHRLPLLIQVLHQWEQLPRAPEMPLQRRVPRLGGVRGEVAPALPCALRVHGQIIFLV